MTKRRSKDRILAERTVTLEAALRKIVASGLKERFMREDRIGAYEAELAMVHGNFSRSIYIFEKEDNE